MIRNAQFPFFLGAILFLAASPLLGTKAATASSRFSCKDAGPCFCMASTAQYYSRSDDRLTITCINLRTNERRYFDSVPRAEWPASQSGATPNK